MTGETPAREFRLRKYSFRNDGSIRNTVFSIIDNEWPAKKEKLAGLIAANENA